MTRLIVTALTAGLLLTACGTTDPKPTSFHNERTESRLHNGDAITVRIDTGISSAPQMLEVVIDENGEIPLQFIDKVKAAGLTPSELGERITASYVPRIYVNCTVNIIARERVFYVGGEVRGPSRYPWTEDMTLLKAINSAGGFTDYSNRNKVDVTRGKDKKTFDCEQLRKHPYMDAPILPGDAIYVPRSLF